MENYYWSTKFPHSDNSETCIDFLENEMEKHCGSDFELVYSDGSYAEIQNDKGELYALHVSGNGDFCNHQVSFKFLG